MRLILSLVAILALAGCAKQPGQTIDTIDLRIPALPDAVAAECPVPPVSRNAKVAALQQRVALYECRDRHKAAVNSYNRVRARYRGGRQREPPQ